MVSSSALLAAQVKRKHAAEREQALVADTVRELGARRSPRILLVDVTGLVIYFTAAMLVLRGTVERRLRPGIGARLRAVR